MAVVERAHWRSAPWGAAQGTTHEIWRAADGRGGYLARASIAEIDAAGPFTALPGFRRWLAVIDDGGGLELVIADGEGEPRRWRGAAGDAVAFDGASAVHATVTRPARVWNLIVREHVPWSAAWHRDPCTLTVPGGVAVVHVVTSGITRIHSASQPIEITVDPAPAIVAHLGLGGC
ncbi:MAG TPA: HutD family protein [Kofleriaceae bacterium]|nr:HutD family protein [Kofleriaceae bacterium]